MNAIARCASVRRLRVISATLFTLTLFPLLAWWGLRMRKRDGAE